MGKILHHLSALGWSWVALFVVLDVVAVACAVLAVMARKRRVAFRTILPSAGATLASFGTTVVAVATGVGAANAAAEISADSPHKAEQLAEGISVAMNGAVFGMLFTLVAGLATLVCLVASLVLREKSPPDTAEQAH